MVVSPSYIFGFIPPPFGGASGLVDPFGGVWGSNSNDPYATAQAAAAAAAAAASNNRSKYPWELESGAGGWFEGTRPGAWDYVASSLPTQTASTVVDTAEGAIEAAKRAANAGGEAAKDALRFLASQGDWFAKMALGLGIGYTAATLLLGAGAVGIGVVLLKSR